MTRTGSHRPYRHAQVRVARCSIMAALAVTAAALTGGVAAHPTTSEPAVIAAPSTPIADHVAAAARRFDLPESWIWAVMRVESGGNPRAISPAGAMGLMQLMPATWARLRSRYDLGNDVFDPHDNIMAGTAFLREMFERYGAPGFLAAYNAGPGRYDDYVSRGRPLPSETVAYVAMLAPIVGAPTGGSRVAVAAPDPLAWTRAALFPNRSDDDSAGRQNGAGAVPDTLSVRSPPDAQPVGAPVVKQAPDGLFILVSARSSR